MALPLSRNTTYGPGSPIKSVDLNDLQDQIIRGGHGEVELILSPYAMLWSDVSPGWTVAGGPGFVSSGSAAIGYLPLPLLTGTRLNRVRFATYGNGVADWSNVIVTRFSAAGVLTPLASSGVINNPPAAWADQTIAVPPTILADGDSMFVEFVASAIGLRLGPIRARYDY